MATDFVALFIALAAFIVSIASLYLTSLRPAEIEVDHVPQGGELQAGGFSGEFHKVTLSVAQVASNAGAHGGLLRSISIKEFSYTGDSFSPNRPISGKTSRLISCHLGRETDS